MEFCSECNGDLRFCDECGTHHHADSFGQDHEDFKRDRMTFIKSEALEN